MRITRVLNQQPHRNMNFESNDPTGSSLPFNGRGAHTPSPRRLKCVCGHCHAARESETTSTRGLSPSAHAASVPSALATAAAAMAAGSSNASPSEALSSTSGFAPDRRTLDKPSLRDILDVGYTAPEMATTAYKAIAAAVSSFETLAGSVPVPYLPISLGYKHVEQLLSSGLSRLSVTRRLLALSSVVVRGKDRGMLPLDLACPFDPALRAHRQQRVARVGALPLRAADLQRLFSSNHYQHGHPDPLDPRAGRFWAPLVGLFTGARVSELESAQVSDVERHEGTWALRIGSDSRIAIDAWASRLIPLHPELVRCGFVAYAAQRKLAGHASLFPNEASRTAGLRSPTLRLWYKHYAKAIGLQAGLQSLPSLRMTFVAALARLQLPRRAYSRLTGLAPQHIGPVVDATCQPPANDFAPSGYDWIRQLQFGGLELSHLYADDPMAGVKEAFPALAAA